MKKLLFMNLVLLLGLVSCTGLTDVFSTHGSASVQISLGTAPEAHSLAAIDIESAIITQADVTLSCMENAYSQSISWKPGNNTLYTFSGMEQGKYQVLVEEQDEQGYHTFSSNTFSLYPGQNHHLTILLGQQTTLSIITNKKRDFPLPVTNPSPVPPPHIHPYPYTNNTYSCTAQFRYYPDNSYLVEYWESRGSRSLLVLNPEMLDHTLSNKIFKVNGSAILKSQWSGSIFISNITLSTNN